MSHKRKGDRRERQAREIYRQAGFDVQPFSGRKWRETDGFGLFDFVALHQNAPVEFVQVKSNEAQGIMSTHEDLLPFFPFDHATARYLVAHDREGWRLITLPDPDVDKLTRSHYTAVDGRESDATMGEPVVQYLRTEVLDE